MSPQESCVFADATMNGGLAHAQALGQCVRIVLPEMALSQSRHWGARQGIAGFAANLAAVSRQVTTGTPGAQFPRLTMRAMAWGLDCVLPVPGSWQELGSQLVALLWVEAGELCHPPRKLNRFHDRSLMLGKITIQFRPLQQITQTEPNGNHYFAITPVSLSSSLAICAKKLLCFNHSHLKY